MVGKTSCTLFAVSFLYLFSFLFLSSPLPPDGRFGSGSLPSVAVPRLPLDNAKVLAAAAPDIAWHRKGDRGGGKRVVAW